MAGKNKLIFFNLSSCIFIWLDTFLCWSFSSSLTHDAWVCSATADPSRHSRQQPPPCTQAGWLWMGGGAFVAGTLIPCLAVPHTTHPRPQQLWGGGWVGGRCWRLGTHRPPFPPTPPTTKLCGRLWVGGRAAPLLTTHAHRTPTPIPVPYNKPPS